MPSSSAMEKGCCVSPILLGWVPVALPYWVLQLPPVETLNSSPLGLEQVSLPTSILGTQRFLCPSRHVSAWPSGEGAPQATITSLRVFFFQLLWGKRVKFVWEGRAAPLQGQPAWGQGEVRRSHGPGITVQELRFTLGGPN